MLSRFINRFFHKGATAPAPLVETMVERLVEDSREYCSVCLDDLESVTTCRLKCNHRFCSSCITEWYKRNHKCPICRSHIDRSDLQTVPNPPPPTLEVNPRHRHPNPVVTAPMSPRAPRIVIPSSTALTPTTAAQARQIPIDTRVAFSLPSRFASIIPCERTPPTPEPTASAHPFAPDLRPPPQQPLRVLAPPPPLEYAEPSAPPIPSETSPHHHSVASSFPPIPIVGRAATHLGYQTHIHLPPTFPTPTNAQRTHANYQSFL